MLKLIQLEWKKNNTTKYIRNAIILAGVLGFLIFSLSFLGITRDASTGVTEFEGGYETISMLIELFVGISFLIFTSVMLASYIVSPYKDKTMNLMFSYPIKRQKILISQMLAVWIFNVIALITTKLVIYGFVLICSKSMTSDFIIDFNMLQISFYIQLIVKSVITVTISFISLFVGLIKKSSKATIVTSFLIATLTQGTVGSFTLAQNKVAPIILMVISLIFGYLSIQGIENKDLN